VAITRLPDTGHGFQQQMVGDGIHRLTAGSVRQGPDQQGDTENQGSEGNRQPLAE
jgi:hypothetical protein